MDPYARIAELKAVMSLLRDRVAVLEDQLVVVLGRIAELERLLVRNSSNSSKPPSPDAGTDKRLGRPTRIVRHGGPIDRTQGKQPASAGLTLSQVIEPDVVVIPLSRAGWIHLVWPGGEH